MLVTLHVKTPPVVSGEGREEKGERRRAALRDLLPSPFSLLPSPSP